MCVFMRVVCQMSQPFAKLTVPAEGLTDIQAADAVRTRMDWKYALSLDRTDPGLTFLDGVEFRGRLLAHQAERRSA